MKPLLVTIDTPDQSLDLAVPPEIACSDLIAMLAPGVSSDTTVLMTMDGNVIDPHTTMIDAGVLDGTRLSLQPPDFAPPPPPSGRRIDREARAGDVVPQPVPVSQRLRVTLQAAAGLTRPGGASGIIERAVAGWKWTDHRTRLDWLISRPRMHHPVIVGVVGHRSDELSLGVAEALAVARSERVVLVNSDTQKIRGSARLGALDTLTNIETSLRRSDLGSVARDRLFNQLPGGLLAIGLGDPTSVPGSVGHLLTMLNTHAAIVVIDCGEIGFRNADMLGSCDQVILSTTGEWSPMTQQTIVASWGALGPVVPDGAYAVHRVSEDEITHIELAVILASGWDSVGIATPVPLSR